MMARRLFPICVLSLLMQVAPVPAQTDAGKLAQTLVLGIPADMGRRQISVLVTPGLKRTADLPDKALQQARRDMLADKVVGTADLRALADHGDGLAAQKYFRILMAGGPEVSASDLAFYGTVAVRTGRVWSLGGAVAAMYRLDPETEPTERKRAYMAMLYPHAWAGNSLALDAVTDLNGPGKLFGEMSLETRARILEQGEKNGDGRAALRLALPLLQRTGRTPQEDEMLRDFLKRAASGSNLAVKTTSTNILALLADEAATTVPSQ